MSKKGPCTLNSLPLLKYLFIRKIPPSYMELRFPASGSLFLIMQGLKILPFYISNFVYNEYEIQIMRFELDMKGSFAYTEDEIRTIFTFIEKGLISPKGILNKKFKLRYSATEHEELPRTIKPVTYALVP
jgi:hypothetical protein